MKALARYLLCILFIGVSIIYLSSCSEKDDKCKNAYCQNGAACVDGICKCPGGYTGTRCELEDKCYGVTCLHAGTCNDGVCSCTVGYEGKYCDTVSRDKFLGKWNVYEKGSTSVATQYSLEIVAADSPSAVINVFIKKLNNYFTTPVNAYVKGDSIFIPTQTYEGKVVFGTGYYKKNSTANYENIIMSYEVVDVATNKVNDFGYNAILDNSKPSTWSR